MISVEIVIFAIFLLLSAYLKVTRRWQKFQSRGIPYATPYFPFGSIHIWKVLFTSKGNSSESFRTYLGTDLMKEKVFGIYGGLIDKDEVLLVNDIDIAKRMLIKDFDYFMDRTNLGLKFDHSKIGDRIFANMFIVQKGDMWKTQRSLMSPVFTTGKLKLMYPLLLKVSKQLEKYVSECADRNVEIDCKETFSKFALDAIATSAFGIEVDTFAEPNSVFKKMVNELERTPDSQAGSKWETFKLLLSFIVPISKYFFDVEQISSKAMRYFQNVLLKTIEMRRNGSVKRNDIIDLVIEQQKARESKSRNTGETEDIEDDYDKAASINMSDVEKVDINMDETLVSNAFLIFVAALDTSSSTLTFAVHFLLKFPHFQDKIRDEITEVIGDDDNITFEQIQNLKYTERFLLETLRNAHPFEQILERECTKDYLIPGTNYTVRKGEVVNFTLLYEKTKNNPENSSFYNAGEFDPENFNPSNNPDSFAFFAFGQGPRNCVGRRYAMLAMKLALVHVLRNHNIIKSKNTKEDLKIFKFIAGPPVSRAEVPFYAKKI